MARSSTSSPSLWLEGMAGCQAVVLLQMFCSIGELRRPPGQRKALTPSRIQMCLSRGELSPSPKTPESRADRPFDSDSGLLPRACCLVGDGG
ncbi:uncharacterized [Tachysurus ichikawai]